MGRAPCCEKVGLKKGPWAREEDHLLINYINENGHGNWRTLPKKAGLLRCGKSCRLRWTNYLRPDIKRGNFSKEEEDTILKLHQTLGNRWSAIAARLPGRTDNEIKNVWHTHFKKRVLNKQQLGLKETKQKQVSIADKAKFDDQDSNSSPVNVSKQEQDMNNQSSVSSTVTCSDDPSKMHLVSHDSDLNKNQELDQDIWDDVVSYQDHSFSPVLHHGCGFNPTLHDDIDFWCDLFTKNEDISDLLEF